MAYIFLPSNEMEAYTSTLGLLALSLICPNNALVSYLKLVPGFRACLLVAYSKDADRGEGGGDSSRDQFNVH